jgi:hypothetical protein
MIVRCIDAVFQTDVLVKGREYEVRDERDDCYILSGFDKGFSKTRFEVVSQPTKRNGRTQERARPDAYIPLSLAGRCPN